MKLSISNKAINAAISPHQFKIEDVIGINPRLIVGELKCCVLQLACNRILIVTNKIVLVYAKLEDFLSGLDPLSLVEDVNIQYDQELNGTIDFVIYTDMTKDEDVDSENTTLDEVRNLMFGARQDEEIPNPELDVIYPPADECPTKYDL